MSPKVTSQDTAFLCRPDINITMMVVKNKRCTHSDCYDPLVFFSPPDIKSQNIAINIFTYSMRLSEINVVNLFY